MGASDLFGYVLVVDRRSPLEVARVARGLTQEAVARRSGTSQPTLSAYERGTKSPTLAVAERILHSLGFDLGLQPRVTFREVHGERGGTYLVPDQLWRVDPPDCFAPIDGLDASGEPRRFNLLDRDTRIEGYIWLLRRGNEDQIFKHLDAALLVDAWPTVAPRLSPELRGLWAPLVYAAGEAAIDRLLIATLRAGRLDPPLSPRRRRNLVERLKDRGLSAEDVRRLIR
jgi:transcriptional regulator with XRE-family HTH domain